MQIWRHYNCNKCSFLPFLIWKFCVVWFHSVIFAPKNKGKKWFASVAIERNYDLRARDFNGKWKMAIHDFSTQKRISNETIKSNSQKKTEANRLFFLPVGILEERRRGNSLKRKNACNLIRATESRWTCEECDSHQTCKLYLILSRMSHSAHIWDGMIVFNAFPWLNQRRHSSTWNPSTAMHRSTLIIFGFQMHCAANLNGLRERTKSKSHFIILTKILFMLQALCLYGRYTCLPVHPPAHNTNPIFFRLLRRSSFLFVILLILFEYNPFASSFLFSSLSFQVEQLNTVH